MNNEENQTKLTLKNVRVAFANLGEKARFDKETLVVELLPEHEAQVVAWVKANNIGSQNPGVARITEYTSRTGEKYRRFAFNMSKDTSVKAVGNLTSEDLGNGAMVSLVARAYTYKAFGMTKTSHTLSAVVITSSAVYKDHKAEGNADANSLLAEFEEANATDN